MVLGPPDLSERSRKTVPSNRGTENIETALAAETGPTAQVGGRQGQVARRSVRSLGSVQTHGGVDVYGATGLELDDLGERHLASSGELLG